MEHGAWSMESGIWRMETGFLCEVDEKCHSEVQEQTLGDVGGGPGAQGPKNKPLATFLGLSLQQGQAAITLVPSRLGPAMSLERRKTSLDLLVCLPNVLASSLHPNQPFQPLLQSVLL